MIVPYVDSSINASKHRNDRLEMSVPLLYWDDI